MKQASLIILLAAALISNTIQIEYNFSLKSNMDDLEAAINEKETVVHCIVHLLPGGGNARVITAKIKEEERNKVTGLVGHYADAVDEDDEDDRIRRRVARRLLDETDNVEEIKEKNDGSEKSVDIKKVRKEGEVVEEKTKEQKDEKLLINADKDQNQTDGDKKNKKDDDDEEEKNDDEEDDKKEKKPKVDKQNKNNYVIDEDGSVVLEDSDVVEIVASVPAKQPDPASIKQARNYIKNAFKENIGLGLVVDCVVFANGAEVSREVKWGYCMKDFSSYKITHNFGDEADNTELVTRTYQVNFGDLDIDDEEKVGYYLAKTIVSGNFELDVFNNKCEIRLQSSTRRFAVILLWALGLLVLVTN